MKTLLLIAFLFFSANNSNVKLKVSKTNSVTDVYICTGKYSKKYHYSKNCRGLSNCKSEIKKVYLNEAKHKGRTLCGWED